MGQFWRNGGVGLLVFCTGLSALAYAGHTLPTLLNGWDEQFYFAAAHSLVYDEDLDITNDIRHCPRSDRFDPGGDGTYRVLAVNPAGRYLNKFPLGLSLAEALWLVPAAGVRWLATAFGYQSPEPPGFSPVEIAAVWSACCCWSVSACNSSTPCSAASARRAGRCSPCWPPGSEPTCCATRRSPLSCRTDWHSFWWSAWWRSPRTPPPRHGPTAGYSLSVS